jgi:hypothetical protein
MVMHRIQADILCQDKDRAQALYDQLVTQAPNFAAVGREGTLFEPSSITVQASTEDEDHVSDLSISDPAIARELYDFLISKHPEYDQSAVSKGYAPSSIRIHDCYHDESPPRPCVISREWSVTPQDAVEKGIPVVGSVLASGEVKVITAEFEAQVLEAKAVRLEAERAAAIEAPAVLPVKGMVTKG